jgi:hypothetical protein
MSVRSLVAAATVLASVTVTLPPPAGTLPDPLESVDPLLSVTWIVAPPQLAGRLPTVTLTTLLADRFWSTESPALVQRGTGCRAAPTLLDANESDAADPTARPTRPAAVSVSIRRRIIGAVLCRRANGPPAMKV